MSAVAWKARRGSLAHREQRATVREWRLYSQQEHLMAEMMLACPWRRRIKDGICVTGCYSEPTCETGEPEDGWESQLSQQRRIRYHRPALEVTRP